MVSEPHVGVLAYLAGYLYVIGGTDSSGIFCCFRLIVTFLKMLPTDNDLEGIIYVAGGWDGRLSLLSQQ